MENKIIGLTIKSERYPVLKYGNEIGENTTKCKHPAHDDLTDAVRDLDIHLAILTGQLPMPDEDSNLGSIEAYHTEWIDNGAEMKKLLNNIICDGFTLEGDGATIILHGTRSLDNAKVIDIVCPKQNFEMDTYDYPFIADLGATIEQVKYELQQYLEVGKRWVNPQGDLFNEEKNVIILEVATKKKRGRKPKNTEEEVTDTKQDDDEEKDEF